MLPRMLLADSHVHIHACFEPDSVFDEAARNFAAAAARVAPGEPYHGILCLAETVHADCFGALVQPGAGASTAVPSPPCGGWAAHATNESVSMVLRKANRQLIVIAGRQIVAAENIEVLALGTASRFDDGEPIDATIDAVLDAGAIVVLPWGFGKWRGTRGAVIDRILERSSLHDVYLGDNANRPQLGRAPARFVRGRRAGLEILPGSDPLPLPGEERRIGAYGLLLDGDLDLERPAASFFRLLRAAAGIEPYGRRERLPRFLRNQIAMQIAKRSTA